jgi:hypothetical protein
MKELQNVGMQRLMEDLSAIQMMTELQTVMCYIPFMDIDFKKREKK